MFFTAEQIAGSIRALSVVHPFHGITFLVCKQEKLPIGNAVEFALDSYTDAFLRQHHRLNPNSQWFFQPFKSSRRWVRPDYSAKGLQAINTQTFHDAFLHQRNTRLWGWSPNYVAVLAMRLPKRNRIPAFDLAVWLYRTEAWPDNCTTSDVLNRFISEFHITKEEEQALFNMSLPANLPLVHIFQTRAAQWSELQAQIPAAPDAEPEHGGTLAYLEIEGVGPAKKFLLEPARRLTLITGDNGLGKTFLLECAWWALTGVWPDRPAYPTQNREGGAAKITFMIAGERSSPDRKTISFDWKTSSWPEPKNRPTIPGLTVYARVDGSFAVWDPIQQVKISRDGVRTNAVLTSEEVWNGLPNRIEGLIRDWVRWQNSSSKSPFETFKKVLAHLSPPDLGQLVPDEPVRIPDDPRDIPTLRHPYGVTPIVYSSAGVRRIMTLAYLIVWAWNEHVVAAELARKKPERRLVVLVDEMEAHLHPLWQRVVLPALISVAQTLSAELEAQYIVATHSPLVMASAETVFNSETDSLVHLELSSEGLVTLREMEFVAFGDASSWLTSPVFELRHARNPQAEAAIEAAKSIQLSGNATKTQVEEISKQLIRYLPENDKFWPRWISFAEKFGVEI